MSDAIRAAQGSQEADQIADAAVVAVLRMLERNNIDREILADMTASAQAAVFAAEARVRGAR